MSGKEAKKTQEKYGKVLKNVGGLEKFVKQAVNENKSALDWAVSDYEFQLAVHKQEFADFVKNTAADVLECDEQCLNDCVNDQYIEFLEIPQCLKYCYCEQAVFDITDDDEAEYNYPELIEYSEHDPQAWSFFRMIQNKL